jgi:hypothetical protein
MLHLAAADFLSAPHLSNFLRMSELESGMLAELF